MSTPESARGVRTKRLTISHPSTLSIQDMLANPLNCEVNVQPTHLASIFEVPVVRLLRVRAQLVSPAWDRRFTREPLVVTLSSPAWNPASFARSATPPSAEPRLYVTPGEHWMSHGIGGFTVPVQGALLANEHEIEVLRTPPPEEGELEWALAMATTTSIPDRVLEESKGSEGSGSEGWWASAMRRHWPKLNRNRMSPLSAASPPSFDSFQRLLQECVDEHVSKARFYLNLQAPLKVRFVWPKGEWEAMEQMARTRPKMGCPTGSVTLTFEYISP